MKQEIKIGDYVRITRSYKCAPNEIAITEGLVGIVVDTDKGYREVEIDGFEDCVWVHISNLELAKPPSKKLAFLQELRELLLKYDASIEPDGDETYLDLYICIGDESITYIGKSLLSTSSNAIDFPLTAKNIMDYDKE